MSAVHITDDVCVQALEHSRHMDENPNDNAKKIAQLMDSSLQRRDLTMGGGYQRDTTSQVLALSDHPHFISQAERHSLSGAVDTELSADMAMQLDLIQAAGSMTKDLKDTIVEISAKAETLTTSQKLKFVEVVFNTYQLQQVNMGRIALPMAQIEKLANDTLEIMRELAIDVILPPSLKTASLNIIKTTAKTFQLPELDKAIVQFEKDTSPKTILEQTVDTLKATLMALLDQDDLDTDARQDIEDTLEKLNELEDGEPIPRDILKSLDKIALQVTDNSNNPALIAIAETLNQNVEAAREANIPVKAEKFNLSIEQVRAIEATMDRLDALGAELPKDEVTLKDMIAEAILALDKDPVSIKAMAKLEIVTDALQEPKFKALEQASPIIATLAAPIATSSKFVQKFLTEKVAQKFDIPVASVKNFVNLYKTIDIQNRDVPKASPLKQIMLSTLNSINKTPASIKTLAKLEILGDVLKATKAKEFINTKFDKATFSNLINKVQAPVVSVVTNQLGKTLNLSKDGVQKLVKLYKTIDVQKNLISNKAIPLKALMKATLLSLNTNPLSIKTMAGLDRLGNAMKDAKASNFLNGKIGKMAFVSNLQSGAKTVLPIITNAVAKAHNIPKASVKQFATAYNAVQATLAKIPASSKPAIDTAKQALKAITTAPVSIATAGLIKAVSNMPTIKAMPPVVASTLAGIQKTQTALITKALNIPAKVVESAVNMVASLVSVRDAVIPTKADIKHNPIVQSVNTLIQKISDTPASVGTLVKGTEVLYNKGLDKLSQTSQNLKITITDAKKQLSDLKNNTIQVIADKANQPVKVIKDNINTVIEAVKKAASFNTDTTPKFAPKSYQGTATPVGLDIDNTPVQKPSLFKKFTGACGDCAGGFCAACKSGVSKALEIKGKKVLTSAFNTFSGVFKKSEPVIQMGRKPKQT